MKNIDKISLVLLAYDQEAYIEDAVRSAIEQCFRPIEIIICDDCSSDDTFQKIKSVLVNTKTKHKVKLIRRERNLGLIKNLNETIKIASGEIIVLAAGDDISEPNRVAKIAAAFTADREIMLVHSAVKRIDAKGKELGEWKISKKEENNIKKACLDTVSYIGATGAIRREVYEVFGEIEILDTYEDQTFFFRARLLGKTVLIHEPLVRYRENIGLSTLTWRQGSTTNEIRAKYLKLRTAIYSQRLIDARNSQHEQKQEIERVLKRRIEALSSRLAVHEKLSKTTPGETKLSTVADPWAALCEMPRYAVGELRSVLPKKSNSSKIRN